MWCFINIALNIRVQKDTRYRLINECNVLSYLKFQFEILESKWIRFMIYILFCLSFNFAKIR